MIYEFWKNSAGIHMFVTISSKLITVRERSGTTKIKIKSGNAEKYFRQKAKEKKWRLVEAAE